MNSIINKLFTLLLIVLFPFSCLAAELDFYDTDNVGSPVAMWDANGNKGWEGEYYPFGEEFRIVNSPVANKKRLIGKEKDGETGLTYFGARYMDETSGRFISPDPVRPVDAFSSKTNSEILANPQRLNRYAYGLNNPYRYVDPDGEFAFAAVALFAAGAWALDTMMPKSTNVSNSMGALDYMDNATMVAPVGAIKNVTKLPKVVNALKGMPLTEAKRLMSQWNKSTYGNISESIRDHASRHGFGDDIAKYLRKADGFNKKGAKKTVLSDGATRWNRKNGEFLIERKGKTVTYGKNKKKD